MWTLANSHVNCPQCLDCGKDWKSSQLRKSGAHRVVADAVSESADTVSDEETTYYLEFLHGRGEIYYVDEFVRITQPDDLVPDSEETSERD